MNVSVGSAFLSLPIWTVNVFDVWPAVNVTTPEAAMKSEPAAAEPATVAQLTLDVPDVSPDRVTVIVAYTVGPPLLPSTTVTSPTASVGSTGATSLSVMFAVVDDGEPNRVPGTRSERHV